MAQIMRDGVVSYAEVRYYMRVLIHSEIRYLAMVSKFSAPEPTLLELSSGTLWSATPGGDRGLCLVDVRDIQAVVAMVPHPAPISGVPHPGRLDLTGRFCVVEKPGLEVAVLGGVEEPVREDE